MEMDQVTGLWRMACSLAEQEHYDQAIVTIEALLASECTDEESTPILTCGHILLAEVCAVTCLASERHLSKAMLRKRFTRAQESVEVVQTKLSEDSYCVDIHWQVRLARSKYLLAKISIQDDDDKLIEFLCHGIRLCQHGQKEEEPYIDPLRDYFCDELKLLIAQMYAKSLQSDAMDVETETHFIQQLQLVQSHTKHFRSMSFKIWLLAVICHATAASFHSDNVYALSELLEVVHGKLDNHASKEELIHIRKYQLLIQAFANYRFGHYKALQGVLKELHAMDKLDDTPENGILGQSYLEAVVYNFDLYVESYRAPLSALKLSKECIPKAQTSLQSYDSSHSARLPLLIGLLEMMITRAKLLMSRGRLVETRVLLKQLLSVFDANQAHLSQSKLYLALLARTHVVIAKYAACIGENEVAATRLGLVIEIVPAITSESYPDVYLAVWIDMLDVTTFCNTVSDDTFTSLQQIYPHEMLLECTSFILGMEGPLSTVVSNSPSEELRAKYEVTVCKFLWAVSESSSRTYPMVAELESKEVDLLYAAFDRVQTSVCSTDHMMEILLLMSIKLQHDGEEEDGDLSESVGMLEKALGMATEQENVVVEVQVLFELIHCHQDRALIREAKDRFERLVEHWQEQVKAAKEDAAGHEALRAWRHE